MQLQTLARQLALTVVIAAAAVPSAWARPIDGFPRTEPPPVRVVPESGVEWADAGAGAAFAAVMIGVGGTLAVRNRRRRVLEVAS